MSESNLKKEGLFNQSHFKSKNWYWDSGLMCGYEGQTDTLGEAKGSMLVNKESDELEKPSTNQWRLFTQPDAGASGELTIP